jgi:zinc and cadmium transporter
MYWYITTAVAAIMLASLAGTVVTWKIFGTFVMPRLRYLVALAAGVFTVNIYGLLDEVLHEGLTTDSMIAFFVGALLLELMTHLLPHGTHHHHGPHPEHTHRPIDARRMMLGDAVHNIHDGLALVPAFIVSPVVGFGTAAGIFLHEVVQEVSEFFVLKEAGYSDRKALLWNFTVSSTILIGVFLAAWAVSLEEFEHALIAFSAGGFTYVLFRDLLPSIVHHARTERAVRSYILMFLGGVAIMGAVTILVPHHHPEEELPLPEGFELASATSGIVAHG